MAYLPDHKADVFISYAHLDNFAWIEGFKRELEKALIWRLRASIKPEIFFDTESLRAGREFNKEIAEYLEATAFFLAIVSQRYNTSTYSRHQELGYFLKDNPPESGRTIQIRLDLKADLPVEKALAVAFASATEPFSPGSEEFHQSLVKVYEPIVDLLDKLYAKSKLVFLAWPEEASLQEERKNLQLEIEGRGVRVYPNVVAEYEGPIRLRKALEESSVSVHFLGSQQDDFAAGQLQSAVQLGKPTIVASSVEAETRRGSMGSPDPIWLRQGNPTIAIANALDQVLGRGRREERNLGAGLGKTPLFLVYKPDVDYTLGLGLRQRIVNRGPFEVLEPKRDSPGTRYEELSRARAALLCWGRAGKEWVEGELDELNRASAIAQLYDIRRAIYLKSPNHDNGIELFEGDRIVQTDAELNTFLTEVRSGARGEAA